ncbi:hypothetical protein Angca_006688, partial [Angiostrongylus cantonensis]
STMDYIYTITRHVEISREYKRPHCLTFNDLQKAFDSIKMEAVMEVLGSQGVLTQYIKILRELYKNFTTKFLPFNNVEVQRGVMFTATLQNVMETLEWHNMGVKIDGRQIHQLRFADDIVLITPDISQAEHMLADFDKACGKIGLRLNLRKTMFMKNGLVSLAPFTLNGTNISDCSSYVYLGREINMMNDLAPELSRRKRAA